MPIKAQVFDTIIMGDATAQRLEHVIAQRERGIVPASNIVDSRYQDLLLDPMTCIASIYAHFGITLPEVAAGRMRKYLQQKPQGRFGQHSYTVDARKARERQMFRRYQSLYDVPDEL